MIAAALREQVYRANRALAPHPEAAPRNRRRAFGGASAAAQRMAGRADAPALARQAPAPSPLVIRALISIGFLQFLSMLLLLARTKIIALVLGPERALIARQDRGIEEPVGHRLKPERHPSLTALARNELAASVLAVELLADHRRIEEVHTLDRERRDLAMGLCSTTSALGTTGETVTSSTVIVRRLPGRSTAISLSLR